MLISITQSQFSDHYNPYRTLVVATTHHKALYLSLRDSLERADV
jgi:hypothetical protein